MFYMQNLALEVAGNRLKNRLFVGPVLVITRAASITLIIGNNGNYRLSQLLIRTAVST